MQWMRSNRAQLLTPDTDIAADIPPGWTHLVRTGALKIVKWRCETVETPIPRLRLIAVREGRLEFELDQGDQEERGVIEATRALSAEICDRCAKKGDPVEDEIGNAGCRCQTCRALEQRTRPREWSVETVPDHLHLVSPGQWTQDIRGGLSGAWAGTCPV